MQPDVNAGTNSERLQAVGGARGEIPQLAKREGTVVKV
jgi:hypothetical protein